MPARRKIPVQPKKPTAKKSTIKTVVTKTTSTTEPIKLQHLLDAVFYVQVGRLWSQFHEAHQKYMLAQARAARSANAKAVHRKATNTSIYSTVCGRVLDYKYKTPDELVQIVLRSYKLGNEDPRSIPQVLGQIKHSRFVMLFLAVQPVEYLVKFRDVVETKRRSMTKDQFMKIELVAAPGRIPFFKFVALQKPTTTASTSTPTPVKV